jgi:hypothetical protein
MKYPRSNKNNCNKKLQSALKDAKTDMPLSYICLNPICSDEKAIEFYHCTGGLLLTKQEFFIRRKEEGEV